MKFLDIGSLSGAGYPGQTCIIPHNSLLQGSDAEAETLLSKCNSIFARADSEVQVGACAQGHWLTEYIEEDECAQVHLSSMR